MKRVLLATALVVGLGAALLPAMADASAASCTKTGFVRDGIDMTAAQIGGSVTGSLDAGTCNIGVYYGPLYDNSTDPPTFTGFAPSGNVTGATIFGANYYGVVVNGDAGAASVNVTNSAVHDIGETPLNGTQHGNAIYYRAFGGTASGTISGNTVTHYQKNGITINGSVSAVITNNTVTGEGPVNYIAQNGIQLGYGAKATVTGNTVIGNAYTGPNGASSAGILVVGGEYFGTGLANTVGLTITKNTLTGNDVGVWIFNADSAGNAPSTATNNAVKINKISDGAVTNTTGYTPTCGYQAGIADNGKKDLIVNNAISGAGYTPVSGDCAGNPAAFVRAIDLSSKARGLPSNK
jgi:parallel beta-helix repeat protein